MSDTSGIALNSHNKCWPITVVSALVSLLCIEFRHRVIHRTRSLVNRVMAIISGALLPGFRFELLCSCAHAASTQAIGRELIQLNDETQLR